MFNKHLIYIITANLSCTKVFILFSYLFSYYFFFEYAFFGVKKDTLFQYSSALFEEMVQLIRKIKIYIIVHPDTCLFPLATILLFYLTNFISTTVSTNKLKFDIRLYYTKGRFKQIQSFCGYLNISVIKI